MKRKIILYPKGNFWKYRAQIIFVLFFFLSDFMKCSYLDCKNDAVAEFVVGNEYKYFCKEHKQGILLKWANVKGQTKLF